MTQKDLLSSSPFHEAQSVRIAIAEGGTLPTDADIVLLPGRAAFLPQTSTVVCSDIHLGKAATFRHAGMPIPEGSAQRDLQRLTAIIQTYNARRLLIAGDLFHARSGCTEHVLDEFSVFCEQVRQSHNTEVVLVLGNHERSLGKKFRPHEIGIKRCEKEIIEPPFRFIHDHQSHFDAQPDSFTIAGHVHPTVTIKGTSGDRLTCRCFVTTGTTLLLPAFGSFTGGYTIRPSNLTRIWLAQIDGVLPIANALVRS
ncbi:MAG: ligase-associated DNA damage response endonuclease PdeM [Planctomycetes bacterium]|nr:ligase-associated DNA damage response endonuclease PdeM [Planctomycetota bacterium]MBL6910570.1 ligase-associated DNA damage response endonuclease PdeM [Pirellulales bacterium]MBL7182586.1 ligase-associated DNA damage response endonuclease PdeM [Pirellulales bacterium]